MPRVLEKQGHLAAATVLDGVARDLRDGGADASLVHAVETEELGDDAGALPRVDRVVFVVDGDGSDLGAHGFAHARATTTTVTSSRSRRWSRNNTPATSDGCRFSSPG